MTWYVYALKDPRDNAIRYVGKSCNVSKRLASHMSPSASAAMREWMLDLGEHGPVVEILRDCGDSETDSAVAERSLIAEMRRAGARLLNVKAGGERPRLTRENHFSGVGERVRRVRKMLGLHQSALASASGVRQPTISHIEAGRHPHLAAETAVLLARALDVSVEWLITGSERISKASAA